MIYSLYIYKPTAIGANAWRIGICNKAVSTGSLREWDENEAARFMEHFDTRGIAAKIRTLVGEKCQVCERKPPVGHGNVEFLKIATSYAQAPAVLPYIHCVAAEYDLVLYDAETKKTFFRELVNGSFINVKLRIADYKNAILAQMKPIWLIRRIGVSRTERENYYAYVVTLRKDPEKSFDRRCATFYRCLSDQLRKDEEINTDSGCFTIIGEGYTISFCLEGYKKRPNQMGYYAQGRTQTKLIRRMGCEEGFFWLKQHGIHVTAIWEKMNFAELKQAYPNPADRFVACVNIQKWESRSKLDIRYCGIGPYGAEILFHLVPGEYAKGKNEISVLAVEEFNAEPILEIVNQFYPYFYERYFLEENHLPTQMWWDIVKEAKKKKGELISSYNYHDAEVLDIFIRWSEAQFNTYQFCDDGRMLNIQGP